MRRIFLLLLILVTFAFSAIDECKTDIYFGNGILTRRVDAIYNTFEVLEPAIRKDIYSNNEDEMYKHIGKVSYAYNSTHGEGNDLLESALQKLDWDWLTDYFSPSHKRDVTTQVNQYEASIRLGHRVLVVAHSQGNLFAYDAYRALKERGKDGWMQQYFEAVSVASPMKADIKTGTPRIDWDNDTVPHIWTSGDHSANDTPNNVRLIDWVKIGGNPGEEDGGQQTSPIPPYNRYTTRNNIGQSRYFGNEEYIAQEGGMDKNVHAFTFYMGKPLKDGHSGMLFVDPFGNPFAEANLTDPTAKTEIMNAIQTQLDKLEKLPSQWEPKNFGCVCDEKYAKLTHKYEKETFRFPQKKVKDFAEDQEGKIYMVGGQYIRAACGGERIEKVDEGEVCLALLDGLGRRLGEIRGAGENPPAPGGLFTAQLNWHETTVHMELQGDLMSQSVSGCGMAAAGSEDLTLYDVYPGSYAIKVVNVKDYEELDDNLSDEITLRVRAVDTSKTDRFVVTNKYQYPALGKGGHLADIVITRPDPAKPPVPFVLPTVDGGYWGKSSRGNWLRYDSEDWNDPGGSHTFTPVVQIDPPLCQPERSCGCLPCEYHILTYLSQARLGPVSGADVRLYKATEEERTDREILYSGKTSISNRIDEAGIITLPIPYPQQPESEYSEEQRAFLEKIKDYDGDFILEVSGGVDIDSNDDLAVDSSFRQLNGRLRLILSKERLMQNDYKVNILTEIAYQLSKDLLGERYDKAALQARLDDIAGRVLIEKLYPDAAAPIGRDDLMWWIPAAHKNWLTKPYDTTLAPIVEKVYRGEEIYDDAYRYVYDPLPQEYTDVPTLRSQWFKVDENATPGTFIGRIRVVSEGNSSVKGFRLEGSGSELFRIDAEGKVYLEENASLDYERTPLYQMRLQAYNEAGTSRPVTLYVTLNNIPDAPEDRGFEGGVVSEDAPEGTVAGRILFDEAGAPIDAMELTGRDAKSFDIDINGTITVSADSDLDYEKAPAAHITVRAHNAYGYSRYIPVTIVVTDAVDVPIVGTADVRLDENAAEGTVVAHLAILSNDPVTEVRLSGSGSENFTVDTNGTVRVAPGAHLDYESKANYVLNVTAANTQGTSRPGVLIVRLNNIPDVPELKRSVFHLLEESPADTYVGKVSVESNGSSPITEYRLSGEGSEAFRIDEAGRIYTATQMPSHDEREFYNLYVAAKNAEGYGPEKIQVVYIDTRRPILGILDSWVYENAPGGTVVGTVPVASTAAPIHSFALQGEGAQNFTVDAYGTIRVAPGASIDYETTRNYTLRVSARNAYGESLPRPVYIRVVDRDDTLEIRGFSTRIHEDIAAGSIVGIVSLLRSGGKRLDHFELSGTGSELFRIDGDGAVRVLRSDFDDAKVSSYHLQVVAVAADGSRSNPAWIDLYIDDSLRGHPLLAPSTFAVEENASVGSVIGTISVIDPGSSEIEGYRLSGDDHFSVDDQGTLRLEKKLDYEQQRRHTLEVVAYNHKTSSAPAGVSVDVINIPDTPPTLGPASLEVAENSPAGTVVGTVPVLSRGESNITGFSLSGEGSEEFTIDADGTIRIAEGANPDYERRQLYALQARARSKIGESEAVPVSIRIQNVPEYVPQLSESTIVASGEISAGEKVGTVSIVSVGDTPISSAELVGEGSELFELTLRGEILAADYIALEPGSTKVYDLYYRMKNEAGWSQSSSLKISLDHTPPKITLVGNRVIYVAQGTSYHEPGYYAFDDVDGDITSNVTVENPVDTQAPVGSSFVVRYHVSDRVGNKAPETSREVIIVRNLNTDLSSWQEDGEGEWVLQENARSVLQTINTPTPAIFHNGLDSQSPIFTLRGKIKVQHGWDDDYIGFVLGYHQGDLLREDADYLLIDWKKAWQDGQRPGLAIWRITGKLGEDSTVAWTHDATRGVTLLQRGKTLGDTGWQYDQEYSFEITFTSGKVQVWINGTKEIDIDGNFSNGSYGFYNFSQDHVVYSAVEATEKTGIPPRAYAGEDFNVTEGDTFVLDGSGSSDDRGIIRYLWTHGEEEVGTTPVVSLSGYPEGEYTFTLRVEDAEGLADEDNVTVTVISE